MNTIKITPALPYFCATFDCCWNAARRIAASSYTGAKLRAHLAAIDEAEAMAQDEADRLDVLEG